MHASARPRQAARGRRHLGRSVLVAGLAVVAIGGCTMTETQQRTASGAGIGAAVGAAGGALFGAFAGAPGTGAAIGAAAGAALGGTGGYIHDQQVKREASTSDAAQLQRENEELRRQLQAQQQNQPQQ
jgi:YMGG-like Gly-zipper